MYVCAFRRVLMRRFNCSFHMSGLMLSTDPLRVEKLFKFTFEKL